jgi:hypothetical protein
MTMTVIFWGISDRDRLVKSGTFVCPNCKMQRYCTHRRIESWFSLFFVPLFRLEGVAEYLKCRDCRHSFELPELRPFLPRGGHLASDLRVELRSGASIEGVERRLVESGVDRETARSVVGEIVGDRRRSCPHCLLTYQGSVAACWECGRPLVEHKKDGAPELDELA